MSQTRILRDALERMRAERSARFLLTGGTGFIGSHIAVELLRRGFRVTLLARSAVDLTAEARVGRLFDWFGLPAESRRGLRVVEADITQTGLGVDPALIRDLGLETDEIIHCASNTSFSERKRGEIVAVNEDGLSHVLAFARASRAQFFHHVSTAFVAGKTAGPCPEAPKAPPPGGFNNIYEETKWRGEWLAAEACGEAGLGLTIYRPSIVYGDSRTGRSLLFNAVYYPVRTAVFLKKLYEKDIQERGGQKAAEMGVHIEPDGTTRLPLRVETSGRGGINLIPVDFFIAAFFALLEAAPQGGVFHIVNGRTKSIKDIIDYTCRFFRLSGIMTCTPEEFTVTPKNPLEQLYDHYVEAYQPYMKDTRFFETLKSEPILKRRGIVCPEFDYGVFSRCMAYAVQTGWGTRL